MTDCARLRNTPLVTNSRRRPGDEGSKPWVDSQGKALTDYPRPSVAVDTAVLTVGPRARPERLRPHLQLQVLLAAIELPEDGPVWGLPGTFLHPGERLQDAVDRSLRAKAGFGRRPRTTQLEVFDDPARDQRGWVLSVAHLAGVAFASMESVMARADEKVKLVPVSRPGPLPFDHADIVSEAKRVLRRRYREDPDPFHLLGATFTMTQLRQVHEAIHGHELQRDTFRRAMEHKVKPTPDVSSGRAGRPSQIYARP